MASASDPSGTLERIEARIADVTHVDRDHGEPFNVLRYTPGQKYDSHYDTFDPASYGPQVSQRVASVLLYLTDVEEGGETHFPLEGREGLERLRRGLRDYVVRGGCACDRALFDALLFWNVHVNATFDKHALHGGCPVVRGEKWVATKWIRDKSFRVKSKHFARKRAEPVGKTSSSRESTREKHEPNVRYDLGTSHHGAACRLISIG